MNQKIFNKNIPSTQATYAPEKTMHQNSGLSYKFEIMDDKNIYSISFDGKLTEEEIKEIAHKTVASYLEGKTIVKEIYVTNKIYNIVVK